MKIATALLVVALSGCISITSEELPVLSLSLELPRAEGEAFTEAMVSLARLHDMRVVGPKSFPGQGADDYISTFRATEGINVRSYTNSEYQTGALTFYCTRGWSIDPATTELKQVVQKFAQLLKEDWSDKPLSVFTGYSVHRQELPIGDQADLVQVLVEAASCEHIQPRD